MLINVIAGFQSHDMTAMLVHKIANCGLYFACNNRVKFPKVVFLFCSVHQHGVDDVRWKPSKKYTVCAKLYKLCFDRVTAIYQEQVAQFVQHGVAWGSVALHGVSVISFAGARLQH